jgi:hypothetical protein
MYYYFASKTQYLFLYSNLFTLFYNMYTYYAETVELPNLCQVTRSIDVSQ